MKSLQGGFAWLGPAFVVIWSGGYIVGSVASNAAPALAVTFWRLLLAGLVLGAIATSQRARVPRDVRSWAAVALVGGLLFGVQFSGVYLGLAAGMPAGTSALLVSACPVLVAVAQALLGWERLALRQWIGSGLGVTGVVVALLDHLRAPGALGPLLWTIVGVLGFATANVLTPRLVPAGVDARAIASLECLAGSAVVLPWALLHGGLAVPFTGAALGSAAWLTLVNGIGGSLVLLALVQRRGATRASSLLFVVPAVTAVASWPILGEPLSAPVFVGLAVAGLGIALVQRPARARRRRPVPQADAVVA